MKTITLLTKPIPLNSLYRCVRSRNILSKKGREVKSALEWEIRSQVNFEPLRGTVELNILLYFGDKRKRDIDAYLKVLLDGMNSIVYEDDSQIEGMHVYKLYDKENPRVIIQVL